MKTSRRKARRKSRSKSRQRPSPSKPSSESATPSSSPPLVSPTSAAEIISPDELEELSAPVVHDEDAISGEVVVGESRDGGNEVKMKSSKLPEVEVKKEEDIRNKGGQVDKKKQVAEAVEKPVGSHVVHGEKEKELITEREGDTPTTSGTDLETPSKLEKLLAPEVRDEKALDAGEAVSKSGDDGNGPRMKALKLQEVEGVKRRRRGPTKVGEGQSGEAEDKVKVQKKGDIENKQGKVEGKRKVAQEVEKPLGSSIGHEQEEKDLVAKREEDTRTTSATDLEPPSKLEGLLAPDVHEEYAISGEAVVSKNGDSESKVRMTSPSLPKVERGKGQEPVGLGEGQDGEVKGGMEVEKKGDIDSKRSKVEEEKYVAQEVEKPLGSRLAHEPKEKELIAKRERSVLATPAADLDTSSKLERPLAAEVHNEDVVGDEGVVSKSRDDRSAVRMKPPKLRKAESVRRRRRRRRSVEAGEGQDGETESGVEVKKKGDIESRERKMGKEKKVDQAAKKPIGSYLARERKEESLLAKGEEDIPTTPVADLETPGEPEGPLAPEVRMEEPVSDELATDKSRDDRSKARMKSPHLPTAEPARSTQRRPAQVGEGQDKELEGGIKVEKEGSIEGKGGKADGKKEVEQGIKELVGSYLEREQEEKKLIAKIEAGTPPTAVADVVPPGGFEGPLAPEAYDEGAVSDEGVLDEGGDDENEDRMKLPKLPEVEGARRRRRRTVEMEKGQEGEVEVGINVKKEEDIKSKMGKVEGGTKVEQEVEKPVGSYLARGQEEKELMTKIEADPDFMFREPEEGTQKYDITAAMIGAGRKTKQGVYVLPYLQTGYIVGLLVWLLCTFVYYPGFPLTELDEGVRDVMKGILGGVYCLNAILAVYGAWEAKKRDQPAAFWGLKVSLLGVLALNELMSNIPLKKNQKGPRKR